MTTKQKRKTRTPNIEARAKAMVDCQDFDVDAREQIRVALANLEFRRGGSFGGVTDRAEIKAGVAQIEDELRELIRKAESGEPVFDVDEIGEQYVNAARIIHQVITEPNEIPQFVYDAVNVALEEAQRRTGGQLWIGSDDEGGYSIERMARLFKYHSLEHIELEPKKDLAQMVADIIAHPDCPEEISGALNEATSDLFNALPSVYKSADYIRALCNFAKETRVEDEEEEGGA